MSFWCFKSSEALEAGLRSCRRCDLRLHAARVKFNCCDVGTQIQMGQSQREK